MNWKTPNVVKKFIIINSAIFLSFNLLISSLGGYKGIEYTFSVFGLVPVSFWDGALWQPLTSMFLHGGLLHLLMNMIALWSIGSLLEFQLGGKKFFGLYMVSGLAGALFVVLFQAGSYVPTVGASGAIAGLLGALAVLHPRTLLLFFIFPVKARTAALFLGTISLLLAVFDPGSQISHLGHLGGLVGGFIFTRMYFKGHGKQNNHIHEDPSPEFSWFTRPDEQGSPFSAHGSRTRTMRYDQDSGMFIIK